MKTVIQRVKNANVKVDNKLISEIDKGLLILVGIEETDTEKEIEYIANKVVNLRIFEDENFKMNKSVLDIGGQILAISQFTLCSETKSGNRPSFTKAMKPEKAKEFYDMFCNKLKEKVDCKTSIFGADMQVSLLNDGPVTIILEKQNK